LSDEDDRLRSLDTEPILSKIMALESAASAGGSSLAPLKDGDPDNKGNHRAVLPDIDTSSI